MKKVIWYLTFYSFSFLIITKSQGQQLQYEYGVPDPFQSSSLHINNESVWSVLQFVGAQSDSLTVKYVINGDTSINNVSYKKIYETQDRLIENDFSNLYYYGSVRKTEGDIYFLPKGNSFDRENLLFKSDLKIGDTLDIGGIETLTIGIVQVESVDSVSILDGSSRKRYNFNRISQLQDNPSVADTSYAFSWIEGIGNTKCPFKSVRDCAFRTHVGETLLCYEGQKTLQYMNSLYSTCYINNIRTSTSSVTNLSQQIIVYPNPAQDYIQLEFPTLTNNNTEIIVYDVIGKKVRQEIIPLHARDHRINIDTLERGVYILIMHDPIRGIRTSNRIIKK